MISPDKKTFPIRWLVVFLSVFLILIASIIILCCIELYNIQKMTNKLIQNSIVFFTILFGFFCLVNYDGKWWLISMPIIISLVTFFSFRLDKLLIIILCPSLSLGVRFFIENTDISFPTEFLLLLWPV